MKVLVKGEVGCSIPLTNNLPMAAVSNVRRSRIGDVVEVRRAARPYDAGDIEWIERPGREVWYARVVYWLKREKESYGSKNL